MIEQVDQDNTQSAALEAAGPLPPDFDDLLDRLARDAEARRACRQARTGADE